MLEITLLRHGESRGNLERRLQGQHEFPLTEAGRSQALRLAQEWKEQGDCFDRIISSPLERALETARIIAPAVGEAEIELDPVWMERSFGSLEGLTLEDIRSIQPELEVSPPFFPTDHGAESMVQLYERAQKAISSLLVQPEGRYLVVSHGGLLTMCLFVILGIDPLAGYPRLHFQIGNTAYSRFQYDRKLEHWAVICINNHSHLWLG